MNPITQPVYNAIDEGRVDEMRDLLADAEDRLSQADKDAVLAYCLRQHRVEEACVALLCGANADLRDQVSGMTPLAQAVRDGKLDAAVMLVVSGADPNLCDHNGNVPAHFAAANNAPAIVELLHRHGADLAYRNNFGQTPAQVAEASGSKEVLAYFHLQGQAVEPATPRRRMSI